MRVGLSSVALVGLLVACSASDGASQSATSVVKTPAGDAPPGTTVDSAETGDVPQSGPFEWARVRTTDNERVISIDFTGGADYEPGNPCTVRYEASVVQTTQEVRVTVSGWSPPPASTTVQFGCVDLGYPRSVLIALEAPLGDRRVINTVTNTAHHVNVEPGSPPPGTPPATPATPAPSEQVTELTCAQSGHPTTPASANDVQANGLTFSGVQPVQKRLSSPMPVIDGGTQMFFEKVFLYVSTPASATTRMTLIAPSDAYLYYTDSDTWQSPIDNADMIRAATKSVSVARCDTDLTGYFGGVLFASGGCVTIEVQGKGSSAPLLVHLPLPGPC